jgi:hypothetical protein
VNRASSAKLPNFVYSNSNNHVDTNREGEKQKAADLAAFCFVHDQLAEGYPPALCQPIHAYWIVN